MHIYKKLTVLWDLHGYLLFLIIFHFFPSHFSPEKNLVHLKQERGGEWDGFIEFYDFIRYKNFIIIFFFL